MPCRRLSVLLATLSDLLASGAQQMPDKARMAVPAHHSRGQHRYISFLTEQLIGLGGGVEPRQDHGEA